MGLVKLKRETPPTLRGGGHGNAAWPGVLEQVAEQGGAWVRVAEYATISAASSTANQVRVKYDPAGRFEIVSRTVGGKGVVFARLKVEAK
jgi:hypothetical protein